MSAVRIVTYDPAWPATFEKLRARAARALGDLSLRIEHVGSTSVPGLHAKPVIDMTVVVRSAMDVHSAVQALATIGYEHRGDLGIVCREAFHAPDDLPEHHLYVCTEGSTPLVNHEHVRDHLRIHEADRLAYGALKRGLAREHGGDVDAYTRAKTAFLLRILGGAALSAEQREEIRRQNVSDPPDARD